MAHVLADHNSGNFSRLHGDDAERRGVEEGDRANRLSYALELVAAIPDPELPMVSIADLGILRGVREEGDTLVVDITPTYSGCPAVDAIRDDIVRALDAEGVAGRVDVVLSPAWTTDWISDSGRAALAEAGIAPPAPRVGTRVSLGLGVRCPRCGSMHTRELSHFGSTACKALWVCERCQEPFDRFKELV